MINTKVLAIANQKGGTGKTTTANAISFLAAMNKKKVLAIDLDPQGNLSYSLGAKTTRGNSFDFINGNGVTIQHLNSNLDVIAASNELAEIESGKGSGHRLKKALATLDTNYDLIIIDTPPTAGELQYNALLAATDMIITLQADIYSLQGLYQIVDTAKMMQQANGNLKMNGIIFTQFDNRSRLANELKETITIKATALGVPYLGVVRPAICVKEVAALKQSLFEYAPKSKPAEDYKKIYELLCI